MRYRHDSADSDDGGYAAQPTTPVGTATISTYTRQTTYDKFPETIGEWASVLGPLGCLSILLSIALATLPYFMLRVRRYIFASLGLSFLPFLSGLAASSGRIVQLHRFMGREPSATSFNAYVGYYTASIPLLLGTAVSMLLVSCACILLARRKKGGRDESVH